MHLQGGIPTGLFALFILITSSVPAEGKKNHLRVAAVHITSIVARAPDNIFARQLDSCPEASQTLCDDGNGCCQFGIACTTSRGIPACNVACTGSRCSFGGCCPVGYRCSSEKTACIKMGPLESNPSPTSGPAPTPSNINSEITGVFTPTPSVTFPESSTTATTPFPPEDTDSAGDGSSNSGTPEPTDSTSLTDPYAPSPPDSTEPGQSNTPNAAPCIAPIPGFAQLVLSGVGLMLGGLH